jgi:two-component sensor histidine kinase
MKDETPKGALMHGIDFLDDPVLVVALDGRILEANAAAMAFFGSRLSDGTLDALLADDGEACIRYLRHAGGSTSPRPGKFVFMGAAGQAQLRTQAARSKNREDQTQIILRLMSTGSDRFAALDRRVKELDAQLHARLKENAALQEALRQNRTLMRELQHRVKNNIQMMMSLLMMAADKRNTPEVAAVVETSRGRLHAMAAVQEALYQADRADTVPARAFLADVVRTAAQASGASDALHLSLEDAELSSEEAHCLALIANELITNAAKYGLPSGRGRITVAFMKDGDQYRLDVDDDGPGVPADASTRTSGLTLVRGLCRQLGGRLEIGGGKGARCSVRFRADGKVNENT